MASQSTISNAALPILYVGDLTDVFGSLMNGLSAYRGVVVVWDAERRQDILRFIDQLPNAVRNSLLAAQLCGTDLRLLWSKPVPEQFTDGQIHLYSHVTGSTTREVVMSRVIGADDDLFRDEVT